MSKLEFDKLRIELWISGTADREGNGGYCAYLYSQLLGKPYTKTIGGYGNSTTVTRMTLKALTEGLKAIKKPSIIHIYTTLPQIRVGMHKLIYEWEKRGWRRKDGGELQHSDLWQEIYDLISTKAIGYKVHYQKESPNQNANLYVIHRSSEFLMKARRTLQEVSLPI